MTTTILDNATVWPGDGRNFLGHVVVRDGRIESVGAGRYAGRERAIDVGGMKLSPGLIDLMLLGGFGCRVSAEGPLPIAREMVRIGVTSVQFCGGMISRDGNYEYARRIREAMRNDSTDSSRVIGWYPEGPFLDPKLTAAMPEHALPPTTANVREFLDECGETFPMINISPGVEGDIDAIRTMVAAGKVVSMANANPPVARIEQCLAAGTSVIGHFNDNNYGRTDPQTGLSAPRIEEVALTDDRIQFIHVIADGVHCDPVWIRLCVRARGIEHLCVVTDAQPQAGCADGPFKGEDGRTFVKAGPVSRTTEGRLCGSTWMLPDQFRSFIHITGLAPHVAIRAVTLNPAASLRMDGEIGLLAPGRVADIVAWDESLRIRHVGRAGVQVTDVRELYEMPLSAG